MCLTVGYCLSTHPPEWTFYSCWLMRDIVICYLPSLIWSLCFTKILFLRAITSFFLVNCLLFSYFPLLFICLIISPQAKVIKWLRHKGLLRMKHNIQCCWDLSGYFREFSKRRINHERRALFQERLTWIISIFLNVSI